MTTKKNRHKQQAMFVEYTLSLENSILKWWSNFRPVSFTEDDHIDNPEVNATASPEEKALAALAGAIAARRRDIRNSGQGFFLDQALGSVKDANEILSG
jgi:hypothetical protein